MNGLRQENFSDIGEIFEHIQKIILKENSEVTLDEP